MFTLIAAPVVASIVTLVVLFLRRVHRVENEMDYPEFRAAPRENPYRYIARVVANFVVSSP